MRISLSCGAVLVLQAAVAPLFSCVLPFSLFSLGPPPVAELFDIVVDGLGCRGSPIRCGSALTLVDLVPAP